MSNMSKTEMADLVFTDVVKQNLANLLKNHYGVTDVFYKNMSYGVAMEINGTDRFNFIKGAITKTIGINLNAEEPPEQILQTVTIEGLVQNSKQIETGANAFCESHRGSSGALNTSCGRLTNRNCNETSCCVFTNNKCVAGSARGPTYNANSNGKTNSVSKMRKRNRTKKGRK